MLTKNDIDVLKAELVPALSEQVKKDLSTRLDWITSMLDKQSGNLQSIEVELTLIRGIIEENKTDHSGLKSRVEKIEKQIITSTSP